ncbi:hypothetical protein V6Z11_A10G118500 [Gossypium hirsutum]
MKLSGVSAVGSMRKWELGFLSGSYEIAEEEWMMSVII